MNEHRYGLRYEIKFELREGGFLRKDSGEKRLADSLMVISILQSPEDGYSQSIIISLNGTENREMTPEEIFKTWLMMGLGLAEYGELSGWMKGIVEANGSAIREFLNGCSQDNEKNEVT